MVTRTYSGLWTKYRPAILKMMVDAEVQPQTYRLSNHEFHASNHFKKGAFTFSLEVGNGKAISGLKGSVVAQDLWEILQTSPRASELIANGVFHFSMDKLFVLRVEKGNKQE